MALDTSMPILVVADHGRVIDIIRTLLRQLGFADVDDANGGADALTKMHGKRYGLIISDAHMQPMSGHDFLKEVRRDPGIKKTPFIMTGRSNSQTVIKAKKAGVNNYIVSPFDAETLKTKMEAVCLGRAIPGPGQQKPTAAQPADVHDAGAEPEEEVRRPRFLGRFTSEL